MCMLFGVSSNRTIELSNTIQKFFNFSSKHPHGWGIALYNSTYSYPLIYKEPKPAYRSNFAKQVIANGLSARIAIAHIRYATRGGIEYNNTHPFNRSINYKEWVFAHNGSVEIDNIFTEKYIPAGVTDSEKIFCMLSDELSKSEVDTSLESQICKIEKVIEVLAAKGKLNLLISDGEYLFVHSNYRDSLYRYEAEGIACFSTKVIQQDKWQHVDLNKLLIYKDGKEIYKGQSHEYEYVVGC